MSRYRSKPLDFAGLQTVGLRERGGKVNDRTSRRRIPQGIRHGGWLDSLPRILAGDSFRAWRMPCRRARRRSAPSSGAGRPRHQVRPGAGADRPDAARLRHGFALNGAAAIHDFEIALAGHTSEDVEAALPDGRFGSAEETGREMNAPSPRACATGWEWAKRWAGGWNWPPGLRAVQPAAAGLPRPRRSPCTWPSAPIRRTCIRRPMGPPSARLASRFPPVVLLRRGAARRRRLSERGIGRGAAGSFPEGRFGGAQSGPSAGGFTTVNFDFLQHYRPRVNVVERPHAGGRRRRATPSPAITS
jgi:hypothetical protein